MEERSEMNREALIQEAYQHGRTLERLHTAVRTLLTIQAVCSKGKLPARRRLLEIEIEAATTLKALSAANGGVIDDVSPREAR